MIISCPNCSTGYLLPEHLVGPGGARVRCPRCQHLFAVDAEGRPKLLAAPGAEVAAAEPDGGQRSLEAVEEVRETVSVTHGGPTAADPLEVAREVLEQLAIDEGEAIERARAERRLFAEFGPALMGAFETYRRRVGEGADAAAFREALRERWGVELVPLGAPRD